MKKLKALPVPPLVREAAVMLWANIVLAVAVFFFLMPSHASVSSIAGAAIVIANFVPLQVSAITLILNVVLLIVGYAVSDGTSGYSIADIANQPFYLIAVGVMVIALLLSLVMIQNEKQLPRGMRPE